MLERCLGEDEMILVWRYTSDLPKVTVGRREESSKGLGLTLCKKGFKMLQTVMR
jgi:hypothetical protein